MIDRVEATRRNHKSPKTSTAHPYAAIEHRVIDSAAYKDLSFSAQSLVVLLARQLKKNNNGQLQASYTWCKKYGFGSEHTLRRAIAELIAHGLIYRTRSHGANGAWAKYAVTWLSITEKNGLFLAGFKPNAWREWESVDGKTTRQKVLDGSGGKCSFSPEVPAENAGTAPAKNAPNELIPCRGAIPALDPAYPAKRDRRPILTSLFAIRLSVSPSRCHRQTGCLKTSSN